MSEGNLSVKRQMSFLRKVWGGDSDGYVFLPWLPGHLNTKAERKARGSWQEVSFKWPEQASDIERHLQERVNDDLYFCPNLFDQPHRTSECLDINQHVLYADLDEVDPHDIDGSYRPTAAWQTSDGRYQALWILSQNEIGLTDDGNENQRLSVFLGADPSGWDCTQALRVPGRVNYKPGKKGQQGVLLWDNGPRYDADDFSDLPEIKTVVSVEDIDDAILESIDRRAAWRRLRMRVSTRCRDYMGIRDERTARDAAESFPEGMSGLLWYVERELADAGASVGEIIAIVRPMAFNKFAGRSDELVRLKREASKAVSITESGISDDSGALEDASATDELLGDEQFSVALDDFLSQSRPRPRWLVNHVWARGTVGFIAGSPKSYKSWIALDMAVSVATGTPFLGSYSCEQGHVLYIQEEDSDTDVEDRLSKVFAGKPKEIHPHGWMQYVKVGDGADSDAPGVYWHPAQGERRMRVSVRKGLNLTSESWQSIIAEECEQHAYDLIIIDTLGTSAGDTDIDKSREVNKALKPLKVLAEEYDVAVCIVHHFSHAGSRGENGKRGGSKMLGSVALHAWVESALYVSEKTEVRPGVWAVTVERESKRATDLRFGIEVKDMSGRPIVDENGESLEASGGYGWLPEIVRTSVIEQSREKSESAEKQTKRTPSWRSLITHLIGGGAVNETRALSINDMLERFYPEGTKRQTIVGRVQSAMAQDIIRSVQNGKGHRYWVDRQILESKSSEQPGTSK